MGLITHFSHLFLYEAVYKKWLENATEEEYFLLQNPVFVHSKEMKKMNDELLKNNNTIDEKQYLEMKEAYIHPSWWIDPQLFADLDLRKNKNITFRGNSIKVYELHAWTRKKLDWKCNTCGHEWASTGHSRFLNHFGRFECSVCPKKSYPPVEYIVMDGPDDMKGKMLRFGV